MDNSDYLKAAQGIDTRDLLNHIAWTDVIKPELVKTKDTLTKMLVESVLNPVNVKAETREQIAGKLYGINFIVNFLEKTLVQGKIAEDILKANNISIR